MGDKLGTEVKNGDPTKAKPKFFQLGEAAQDFQWEMSWELRLKMKIPTKAKLKFSQLGAQAQDL